MFTFTSKAKAAINAEKRKQDVLMINIEGHYINSLDACKDFEQVWLIRDAFKRLVVDEVLFEKELVRKINLINLEDQSSRVAAEKLLQQPKPLPPDEIAAFYNSKPVVTTTNPYDLRHYGDFH